MNTLRLYEHADSPNARKVRLLLSAGSIQRERIEVDLLAGGTRSPEFRAINRAGKIPVIDDAGFVLPESNAIVVYLAETRVPWLWPASAALRAQALRWMFWQSSGMTAPIAAVGYQRLIRPLRGEPPDRAAVQKGIEDWQPFAEVLEGHLDDHEWLAGDLSCADIAVGAWVELADWCGMLDASSKIASWLHALQSEDWWQAAAGYDLFGERPWKWS